MRPVSPHLVCCDLEETDVDQRQRARQQCGQAVNTQTLRGRAGLQTGLISPGLSRPADMGSGGAGGGDVVLVVWAPFIHSSPVSYLSVAGSVVIWAVRIQLEVRH